MKNKVYYALEIKGEGLDGVFLSKNKRRISKLHADIRRSRNEDTVLIQSQTYFVSERVLNHLNTKGVLMVASWNCGQGKQTIEVYIEGGL